MPASSSAIDADAEQARQLLRAGRAAEAEPLFRRLLDADADHVEALRALAMIALSRREPAPALEWLARALALGGEDARTLHNLGFARELSGDAAGAEAAYRRALALDPELELTRLYLAALLETQDEHAAALHYLRALTRAQSAGRWRSRDSTPGPLRPRVERAIGFVIARQQALFDEVAAPLRARYGRALLERVERCLRVYLGQEAPPAREPAQKPGFLDFPGLRAQRYYDPVEFGWRESLEAQTPAIRSELEAARARGADGERVFHTDALESANLHHAQGAASWKGLYFYRHGESRPDTAAFAPKTSAAIERLPLARVRGNAPEVMFSALSAGTHLLPHRGVTNTRLVMHLPLIVPPDCALRVGGEIHEWREGRIVVFDDTFEHEAWNRSGELRVVLIADLWHPDLSEAERAGVAELAAVLSDFRRQSETV